VGLPVCSCPRTLLCLYYNITYVPYSYDLPGWEPLLGRLCETVQNEQGDVHLVVGIIDPLAEIIRHQPADHDRLVLLILPEQVAKAFLVGVFNSASASSAGSIIPKQDPTEMEPPVHPSQRLGGNRIQLSM